MAKQITPQGYIYGSDPKSHHPFWEEVEVVEPLEITPTEEEQVITAPEGVIGYNPITVKPAAAEPFLETLNVAPSTVEQFIDAEDYEVDGWNIVDVAPVTAAIDPNINEHHVIKGISILGVDGAIPFNIATSSKVVILGINPSEIRSLATGATTSITKELTTRSAATLGVIETFNVAGERGESVTWKGVKPSDRFRLEATNDEVNLNNSFKLGKLPLSPENWGYIYEDMIANGFVAVRGERISYAPPVYNYLILVSIPSGSTSFGVDIIDYLVR